MRVIRGLPSPSLRRDCALAIGNFDGVHLGHQALLAEVVRAARVRGLMPAVLTFEPHPKEAFGASGMIRVCTLRDKIEAILACGIERVCILPFSGRLSSLAPEGFAKMVLAEGLSCRQVFVGENFRFGAGRAGGFADLVELGSRLGFEAGCLTLFNDGAGTVSSSRIRDAMEAGDLAAVRAMLGRPYTVTGRIVHGARLGRTLGFPTVNQFFIPPGSRSRPGLHGVFAVRVSFADDPSAVLGGMASLGVKPTVSSEGRWLLETNIFDWSGDAYGRIARVELVRRLRGEKKFPGLAELRAAIAADELQARRVLSLC